MDEKQVIRASGDNQVMRPRWPLLQIQRVYSPEEKAGPDRLSTMPETLDAFTRVSGEGVVWDFGRRPVAMNYFCPASLLSSPFSRSSCARGLSGGFLQKVTEETERREDKVKGGKVRFQVVSSLAGLVEEKP